MSELDVLLSERNQLDRKIEDVAKQEFGAAIAGLFEKYPDLENFGWYNTAREYNDEGEYPMVLHTDIPIEDDRPNFWGAGDQHLSDVAYFWNQLPEWLKLQIFPEDDLVVVFKDRIESYDAWY